MSSTLHSVYFKIYLKNIIVFSEMFRMYSINDLQLDLVTVSSPISAGSQASAAPLGIHTETSASPLINATRLNARLIRIVTIFF